MPVPSIINPLVSPVLYHFGYVTDKSKENEVFTHVGNLDQAKQRQLCGLAQAVPRLQRERILRRMFFIFVNERKNKSTYGQVGAIAYTPPTLNGRHPTYIQGAHITASQLASCACNQCLQRRTTDLRFIIEYSYPLLSDEVNPIDIEQHVRLRNRSLPGYPVCERLILSAGHAGNLLPLRPIVMRDPLLTPSPVHRVIPGARWISDIFLNEQENDGLQTRNDAAELKRMKIKQEEKMRKTAFRKELHIRRRIAATKGSADWNAEVLLIGDFTDSSIGLHRTLMAAHILRCHGVEYFIISGRSHLDDPDGPEAVLLSSLHQLNRFALDQTKIENHFQLPLKLPQILVDGVVLGDLVDLQDLIDDGDLDYVLAREYCPRCFAKRNDASCHNCAARYRYMVDRELLGEGYFKFTTACAFAGGIMSKPDIEQIQECYARRTDPNYKKKNDPKTAEDFKRNMMDAKKKQELHRRSMRVSHSNFPTMIPNATLT